MLIYTFRVCIHVQSSNVTLDIGAPDLKTAWEGIKEEVINGSEFTTEGGLVGFLVCDNPELVCIYNPDTCEEVDLPTSKPTIGNPDL